MLLYRSWPLTNLIFTFNINLSRILFNRHFLLGNYLDAYHQVKDSISFLKSRNYQVTYPLVAEQAYLILVCKVLGKFDEAEVVYKDSLSIAPQGTLNWFAVHQSGFFNRMAVAQYDLALESYSKATKNKFYNYKTGPDEKEIWHILGAYLYIAYKLTGQEVPKDLKTYRSSKYLSDISKFSHDKNGLNAAAMIAHLILLHIEDVEDRSKRRGVIDRLDALDKYKERHLPKDIAPRSRLFVEILCEAAKYNFDAKTLTNQGIEKEIEALKAMSNNDVAQPFELEIIPYETLLDLLLGAKKIT
jgi:tetratricopeptide (TPR) repeat protein